jgi:hypothetical protein
MTKFKNIDKIKPEALLALTREVLDQSTDFCFIDGIQPFLMSFENKKYHIYVKNISSAYFSDRDATTRAQLPMKFEFEAIKLSPYPFIFLGYDGINDVFVCWNFHLAKERLNVGKSVSFYSRTFFQSEVKDDELVRRRLKNGDLPVLFKRSNIVEFFKKIDTFFIQSPVQETDSDQAIISDNESEIEQDLCIDGKLLKINNLELLTEIDPFLKSGRLLSAAQIVGKYYDNKYPAMQLTDWISLVRNIEK